MKKLTKLMLTLTLLVLGVGGVNATKLYADLSSLSPASNGSWNVETNTYTWTASYSNLATLLTFTNGELAEYTSIHLTTSGYTQAYRICFMNGSTLVATISFYSAGQKDLVFAERDETKDLDLSQITHISFGGSAFDANNGTHSIVLTRAYIEKPTTVDFDATGIATIGLTDINVDSNLTFDDQTGEMTSNGQGTFSVNLSNEDFSTVSKIELLRSGDDIVQTLQITDADNGVLNTWYSSKYTLNFTTDFQAKAGKVTKLAWNCNTEGTMTITGIRITSNVISATYIVEAPAGSTDAKNLTGTETNWANSVTYPKEFAVQGASFGNGDGSNESTHVNIDGYDYLHLVVSEAQSNSVALRVWIWDDVNSEVVTLYAYPMADYASVENWEDEYRITAPGTYVVKVSDYKYLKGVKAANNWGAPSVTVSMAYMSTGAAPVAFEESHMYQLSGSGLQIASTIAALADVTATSYDATGVTGSGVELTAANPNALFKANAGVLSNAQNVIVDGTCAKLVLTDKKPFKAPVAFTATTASFEKTLSGAATMVLPFNATIPEGVEAYNLTAVAGDAVTAEKVDVITADQPVLLNGTGTVTFTGSAAAVAATADGAVNNGVLYGVYADGYVPASSYVLQNGASGLGFYPVKAENTVSVAPFRAYLTAATPARSLRIVYAGETTGIESMDNESNIEDYYDLQGRRVAQPTKGLYIVNGKKVMVK